MRMDLDDLRLGSRSRKANIMRGTYVAAEVIKE